MAADGDRELRPSMGAIAMPRNRIKELGVCWNDCFRNFFGFHRWESVKELQWFLRELPFEYIYDLYRWRFLTNRTFVSESLALLMDVPNLQYGHNIHLSNTYETVKRNSNKADCVMNCFLQSVVIN